MRIHNKVLVTYTVERASFVAKEIVRLAGDPKTEAVGSSDCTDNECTVRLLITLIHRLNVNAMLTVGLGCEYVQPEWLADIARKEGKGATWMFIQQENETRRTIKRGLTVVGLIRERLKDTRRKPMRVRDLIIEAGCGGSDYTSRLAGDVVVGWFFDRLTGLGGTAIFKGVVEAIGLREMLARYAASERVRQEIGNTYDKALEYYKSMRQYLVNPGNFAGRLSTIEEESMGAPIRSGSRPIEGVLRVGIKPPHSGLWLSDSTPDPYWMQFGITNPNGGGGPMDLVVCHSHIVFLVTGEGNVVGSAVVPYIKITGNSATYRAMEEDIDFDARPVLEGRCPQDEMIQRLLKMATEAVSGTKSKNEALGHKEYFIPYKYQDRDAMKKCREA